MVLAGEAGGLKLSPRGESGLGRSGLSGKYKLGLNDLLGLFTGLGAWLGCVLRGGLGGSMLSCSV